MKITLTEAGGWSAGVGPTCKTIDFSLLDSAYCEAGKSLVEKLMNSNLHSPANTSRARDAMTFDLSIEEKGKTTVCSAISTELSPEFAELVGWIKKQTRKTMRKEK